MVSAGTDDAYTDAIALIPSSIAINNVDAISSIEIVHSTLPIDFPYLKGDGISTVVQRHVIRSVEKIAGWEPRYENGHAGPIPSEAASANKRATQKTY